jgi:hypothetical protein
MDIYFYDLRNNPSALRGRVSVADIFADAKEKYQSKIGSNPIINFDLQLDRLDPIPQNNPQRWEQTIGTLIFSISGQLPTREDTKKARQLYEALPRDVRRSLGPELVFGSLPYLITACKVNLGKSNQNGTNSLDNVVNFSKGLLSDDPIFMRSYFCAHKERRVIAPDMLRASVQEEGARRAVYLVNGLVKNSPNACGRVNWHHARGTPFGMNTVFPNIFLNYVDQGILPQLGETIDRHYQEMGDLFLQYGEEGVDFFLDDVNFLFSNAERTCEGKFGSEWRSITESDIEDSALLELVQSATNTFQRFLSTDQLEGAVSENGLRYLERVNDDKVKETIRLFRMNSEMSLTARSLIDVMFYQSWGELAKEESSIAFGLDRDHECHQVRAFSRGYSGGYSPIVYARETFDEKTIEMEGLNHLALRQFWR